MTLKKKVGIYNVLSMQTKNVNISSFTVNFVNVFTINLVKEDSQPTLQMAKLSLRALSILPKIIHLINAKARVQIKVSKTTDFTCSTLAPVNMQIIGKL